MGAVARRGGKRALCVEDVKRLEDLPNVGKAIAEDLRQVGIVGPMQMKDVDPWALYETMCRVQRRQVDPCMLDVLISIQRFMSGAPALPWWSYTEERKRQWTRRG